MRGGHAATILYKELLSAGCFDYLIAGEAEESLRQLADSILRNKQGVLDIPGLAFLTQKGLRLNQNISVRKNLDDYPFMDREVLLKLIDLYGNKVEASIIGSRGCFRSCSFCSVHEYEKYHNAGPFRMRSVENILEEMTRLNREYSVTKFYFPDSNWLPSGKAGITRLKRLKELQSQPGQKWKLFVNLRVDNITPEAAEILPEIGVSAIFLGVESFDAKVLNILSKGISPDKIFNALKLLRKAGYSSDFSSKLRLKFGYIMFTPESTVSSLSQQLKICEKVGIPAKKLGRALEIYRGTEVARRYSDRKWKKLKETTYAEFDDPRVEEIFFQYRTFLKKILPVREPIRALQKAGIKSQELDKLLRIFEVSAYRFFSLLLEERSPSAIRQALLEESKKLQNYTDEICINELFKKINSEQKNLYFAELEKARRKSQ